jgi:hypothetical protein
MDPSPGHRLRPKTSDITEFFRTGHSSRSRPVDAADPGPLSFPSPIRLSESVVARSRFWVANGKSRRNLTRLLRLHPRGHLAASLTLTSAIAMHRGKQSLGELLGLRPYHSRLPASFPT